MEDSLAESSHPFTCISCQVAFRAQDLQKAHLKTDWHRYNLKRRIATLPPVDSAVFAEKELQSRDASSAAASKATFERACAACQRTYYSENSFQNHLSSQKHRANELAMPPTNQRENTGAGSDHADADSDRHNGTSEVVAEFDLVVRGLRQAGLGQRPSPVKRPSNPHPAEVESSSPPPLDLQLPQESAGPSVSSTDAGLTARLCLFCNYASPTVALSAHHMERFHGMFIPERRYLTDLDGLISQLACYVREHHRCIACGTTKASAFAVQTHMRDKAHCTIPYKTEAEQVEIGDFYDFRSTYSDCSDEDWHDNNRDPQSALPPRAADRSGGQGGAGADEDDGWVTDSSVSSLDSADLTAVPAEGHLHQYNRLDRHPHHSRTDPRHHLQPDGWHSHAHKHARAVFYDEYELCLPSGKTVGHRAMARYYRQNLPSSTATDAGSGRNPALIEDGANAAGRGRRQTRELVPRSAAGLTGVSDQTHREIARMEHRGRSLQQFHVKKQEWVSGSALNNQKRYYYRYERGG